MSIIKNIISRFFHKNTSSVSAPVIRKPTFEFPEVDENGRKRLAIYTLPLAGIKQSYEGVPAQDTMLNVSCGDQVYLHALTTNRHDKTAVLVTDENDDFLGWIPRDSAGISASKSLLKEDIHDRLMNGVTVLARVKSFDTMESNDDYYICNIEIARYEKPRGKKQ